MVPPRTTVPRALTWILCILGVAGTAALIIRLGARDVLGAIAGAGWGIAAVAAWRAVPLLSATMGWRALIPPSSRPRLHWLFLFRWIADSVNNLLPVAQIGGDMLRVRLSGLTGLPSARASASIVGDLTAGMLTQVIFATAGLALLLAGADMSTRSLVGLGVGLLVLIGMLVAFALLQKTRLFRKIIARVTGIVGAGEGTDSSGVDLEAALADLYADRRAFIAASAFRLLGWALGSFEVWIALRCMGLDASPGDALILESLGQATRTAGFFVPAALGIQEGGLVFLGSLIGLSPSAALALSLVKRAREIITGLPALLAWPIAEARQRASPPTVRSEEIDVRSAQAERT